MDDDDDAADDGEADDEESLGEPYEVFWRYQRATFLHALPDGMLGIYVQQADRGALSFGITLTVDGVVITGTVVGEETYMRDLSQHIEEAAGDSGLVFTIALRSLADVHHEITTLEGIKRATEGDPWADEGDGPVDELELLQARPRSIMPQYIHLLNATIWQGGERVAKGVAWRGRLSMVSGWTIGEVDRTP